MNLANESAARVNMLGYGDSDNPGVVRDSTYRLRFVIPHTAKVAAFKFNAVIGLAVLIAFALEPSWRTVRPLLER